MEAAERSLTAQRAAMVSVLSAVVIVSFKLAAAWASGSIAVLAEGMQSLLDVAMSLAALWAIRISAKPPDEEHPFGHGKAELLLSAFQMVLVIVTAGVIAWQAALRLHDPRPIEASWGVAAMGYAVVANLAVVAYLRRVTKLTGSAALTGETSHLVGDAFASAGVLVGLVAYMLTKWPPIDPLLAIAFTALGAVFAVRQLRALIHPLMDGSLPAEDLAIIERVLTLHPESRGFHNVLTRRAGLLRIVGLHVMLDDDLTFVQAHETAEHIEQELSDALGGAFVTVHYEPYEAEVDHQKREHAARPS